MVDDGSIHTEEFIKGERENSKEQKHLEERHKKIVGKYQRTSQERLTGKKGSSRSKRLLQQSHNFEKEALEKAVAAEVLLPENEGFLEPENELEKTYSLTQAKLKGLVDDQTKRKIFDLNLDILGPYKVTYSRSSRSLLLAGKKGHVGLTFWREAKLQTELYLSETIRDLTFLHTDQYFALAQRKYTFIYDAQGIELHCLREHRYPTALTFLPYHLLLVSSLENGNLIYTDTSLGTIVSKLDTKMGKTKVLAQNMQNGIIHLGHKNGVISFWTPVTSNPLVKISAHRGPVTCIGFDPKGQNMITTGSDKKVKIWDLRTFRLMKQWSLPCVATEMNVSQRGLLALGMNSQVWIWKDYLSEKDETTPKPYMKELIGGNEVHSLGFCPFEDVLGVGHATGFSSMVVPGAGEPNFDTFESHPYETKRQRREKEVRLLLEKLPPATITLNPQMIGTVEQDPQSRLMELKHLERNANTPKDRPKKRKRGRNKLAAKLRRKQHNVIDQRRLELQERLAKEKEERRQSRDKAILNHNAVTVPDGVPTFLSSLYEKKKKKKTSLSNYY
ncbi:U3 small nucleolar RNA-associated protein 7 [Galdieria sulphuraria]|uniref:U3 small nucleolar RNA-associated protein 7 n=1 Tax=Galdieria sulphuraria TaxID=130081 RepID=M2X0M7_GALSU|nr:U3 small nucleolar RNA-associated protein 7 [Galdieria sulphuraria]EME29895.1 U3 small nucleolar RNA-associated protein 7 [Galdieria sulphuraria]GJD11943.1 U3 small nucleolar RNA-associated protein 7 [Galdieria sulphuraria]|eukprot:XP_005706415.1 U3 small nucleolar RNA-associated protein 7 [Galdieria sulphuraria]